MTRRFWVGLALSVPPVVLEMGGHLVGDHSWVNQTLSNWIQLVFATPVVIWAGWPFFVRGWQSLLTRNLNMFTLIAMGVGVAYVYSVVGTVIPESFPETFRGHGGAVAIYFEAAAVITVLVLLGQVLELRAREATSGAIKALLQLAPKTARRIGDDGTDHEVQIESQIWRDQPDLRGTEFSRGRGSKDKRQEFLVWIREGADDGDRPCLGAAGKPQVSFSVGELSRLQMAQLVVEVVGKLRR